MPERSRSLRAKVSRQSDSKDLSENLNASAISESDCDCLRVRGAVPYCNQGDPWRNDSIHYRTDRYNRLLLATRDLANSQPVAVRNCGRRACRSDWADPGLLFRPEET